MAYLACCLLTILCGNMRFHCTFHLTSLHLSVLTKPMFFSDVISDQSVITFNIYDRADEEQGFLGMVEIKPVLKHDHTVDQWYKYVLYFKLSISCPFPPSAPPGRSAE